MDTDDKIDILAAILAIGAATLGARANEDCPAQAMIKQYDRIRDELRSKRDFLVSNAVLPGSDPRIGSAGLEPQSFAYGGARRQRPSSG